MKSGIVHERIVEYTPEQNGDAEREHGTIIEKVRALIFDAGLSRFHCVFAASTANFILKIFRLHELCRVKFQLKLGLARRFI